MTVFSWSDALRRRILADLKKYYVERNPRERFVGVLQAYYDSLLANDVSVRYWRHGIDGVSDYATWLVNHATDKDAPKDWRIAVALDLFANVASEWRQAHDAAQSFRDMLAGFSRWNPVGESRRFLDPDAIEKPEPS